MLTLPAPVDTDADGVHDRLCWVTWYSTSATSFNRQGMAGCHDITADPRQGMESNDGARERNDNDEIAVPHRCGLTWTATDPKNSSWP